MLAQLKALEGYTNARGLLPGLSLIHVLPDQMAWAGDGDVELWLFDHPLPGGKKKWDVSAQQLVSLVKAAGEKAVVEVQEDQQNVFITGTNFEGTTPLVQDTSASLWEAFDQDKASKLTIAAPIEFTTGLGIAAKYAAQEANAGQHWTAVVLRGGALYASNQGYGYAKVKLEHPVVFDQDVLIPARACQSAAESGLTVTELLISNQQGLGAFLLEGEKAAIVFRLVAPSDSIEGGYPDMDSIAGQHKPAETSKWADAILLQLQMPRVSLATDAKLPVVELKHDAKGWMLYACGNGEASVGLPLFKPEGDVDNVALPTKRWDKLLTAAAEVFPNKDGIWFRSGFVQKDGKCVLEGMETSFVAPAPAEKKSKAKKVKAEQSTGEKVKVS